MRNEAPPRGKMSRSSFLSDPFFVVGAERSGSTVLRLMLDHHPQISCPHEYDFAIAFMGADGRLPEVEAYRLFLQQNGVFRRSGFEIDPSLDYLELQRSFLEQRRRGRPIVGGTVHLHFSRLLRIWPSARMIHLVRDPRAVALSVVERGWAGNAWAGSARWVEAEREWDLVCHEVPPDRRIEVRYEDLLRDPPSELARICAFLGVRYDAAMLRYPENSTYTAPDPGLVERWRSVLSPRDQGLVDARAAPWLERRGYEWSECPMVEPSAWGRARLRLQDRLGRARFATRRLGPGLYFEYWLARRLGLDRWRGRVEERVRTVKARYVK